jgi:hypothetical protein
MNALEQVLELKKRAVDILLAEREQIDAQLDQLGYGKENPASKRGPPRKLANNVTSHIIDSKEDEVS